MIDIVVSIIAYIVMATFAIKVVQILKEQKNSKLFRGLSAFVIMLALIVMNCITYVIVDDELTMQPIYKKYSQRKEEFAEKKIVIAKQIRQNDEKIRSNNEQMCQNDEQIHQAEKELHLLKEEISQNDERIHFLKEQMRQTEEKMSLNNEKLINDKVLTRNVVLKKLESLTSDEAGRAILNKLINDRFLDS